MITDQSVKMGHSPVRPSGPISELALITFSKLRRNLGISLKNFDLIPPQLAAAMSHPTRVDAMTILSSRTASPREIAAEIDEPLSNVTYHLKQLQQLGCIELVRSDPVHGGRVIEKFYRGIGKVYFDDAAWSALSPKEQLRMTTMTIRMVSEDIEEAMASGTFFEPSGAHVVRSPMKLDEEGWQETVDVITRATNQLLEVEERVRKRCPDQESRPIHAKVEIVQFRSPAPGPAAAGD